MHTSTLHALPSCTPTRVFELRRAAQAMGVRYIPGKPRLNSTKAAPSTPFGGDAA
ncbi:hypothetical protein PKB_1264 [Pseudomonas knackmussii B13]|uniref:Uncharacterized protein n=1 Tax=Pseudomonas knackmussii (strain DSM 6978 / CCUG 54928 / LMG 23759 / B13) TaxID=1301098 RepID=A0A024HDH6_PSEKB|nr:hypothetical protein PKB_1264 [Pseudomonas knackmussii B13]